MVSRRTHVPCEEDKHRPNGCLSNVAFEVLLSFSRSVLQALTTDLQQVFSSFDCRLDLLPCVADRTAHLLGKFAGQLITLVREDL